MTSRNKNHQCKLEKSSIIYYKLFSDELAVELEDFAISLANSSETFEKL